MLAIFLVYLIFPSCILIQFPVLQLVCQHRTKLNFELLEGFVIFCILQATITLLMGFLLSAFQPVMEYMLLIYKSN